jgi:hypothetical protein
VTSTSTGCGSLPESGKHEYPGLLFARGVPKTPKAGEAGKDLLHRPIPRRNVVVFKLQSALCQATLSIGLYLLLEGAVPTRVIIVEVRAFAKKFAQRREDQLSGESWC